MKFDWEVFDYDRDAIAVYFPDPTGGETEIVKTKKTINIGRGDNGGTAMTKETAAFVAIELMRFAMGLDRQDFEDAFEKNAKEADQN